MVSTTCGAFPFSTLYWKNEAICALTNECAPRHHHDGGTTSPHCHSFDHILCCTGPIFAKLKPLARTCDTSYAAKNKIPKISASANRTQCAFIPTPKLMRYQRNAARFHSVPYTGRIKQFTRSQTNVPHGTTMIGGQHHCTITLLIISCAVLVRFSPN